MRKILVSVTNDLYTDQRVHKVCTFLHENNFEVTLIGRMRSNTPKEFSRPYKTKRFRLIFDKGPFFYMEFNIRLFLFLVFHKSTDLLANDLDTLLANYLAKKLKRKNCLFYDSHEYFTEVPELIQRPGVRKIWLKIEKFIFPKLKSVYTVNQSIADIYTQKYGLDVKVVRNISAKISNIDPMDKASFPELKDKFCVIMQGAGINIDRGAEELILALQSLPDVAFLIVGNGDVIEDLKKTVLELNLEKQVLFVDKKPYVEMMRYTAMADVGVSLDKASNPNYMFSLPNKLFDYIHAGTPVLASKLIEIEQIVSKYEVGVLIDEVEPNQIVNGINKLKNNPQLLNELRINCEKATAELNWENECKVLKAIYLDA